MIATVQRSSTKGPGREQGLARFVAEGAIVQPSASIFARFEAGKAGKAGKAGVRAQRKSGTTLT